MLDDGGTDDGEYVLYPPLSAPAFTAYCHQGTAGGGWMKCGNVDEVVSGDNTTCVFAEGS